MIDRSVLDQICESNDIVSVIEQYLQLKKSGSSYKACCPFHEEDTPSFMVSDKKQIFKCFGCGKGGNVIQFVKDIERISFFEAAEKLAARAGIVLNKQQKGSEKKSSKTKLLHQVYELAKDYYCDNLKKFGDPVNEYLKERGISPEIVAKFEVGYSLNSASGLFNYLKKNSINEQILMESGLFIKTQYGMSDLFRERVIFPIHSASGNIVAFGGRVLNKNQPGGKYVNSPTTPVYTKGNELYGFHHSKNEIGKKKSVIITEGYLDFFRLYDNGFTNSVAALGTAVTEKQIKMLARFADNFYMMLDADLAGVKAAIKTAGIIIATGKTPYIVKLPWGEDADTYLQKKSAEDLDNLISQAQKIIPYIVNDKVLDINPKDKIELLAEIASNITDQVYFELFVGEIADAFNVSEGAISRKTKSFHKKANSESKANKDYVDNIFKGRYIEERNLLVLLMNQVIDSPKVISEIDSSYFLVEGYKKIFEVLTSGDYIMNNEKVVSVLSDLEEVDKEMIELVSELSVEDIPDMDIKTVLDDIKIRKYQFDLRTYGADLSGDRDTALLKKRELLKKIRQLSSRVINKRIR